MLEEITLLVRLRADAEGIVRFEWTVEGEKKWARLDPPVPMHLPMEVKGLKVTRIIMTNELPGPAAVRPSDLAPKKRGN